MKGIYISVPDNEFSFFMAMLGKFKHATIIKTDEFTLNNEIEETMLPWQIEEINIALEEEKLNPKDYSEANEFMDVLRKRRNV